MKLNRRDFLHTTALGAGALALGGRRLLAADKPAAEFDPYAPVTLGKTKVKMSRLCIGTGVRGGNRASNHTRMGQEKFSALIHEAHDRGVKAFDVADLYGTHPYLATALKEIPRDKYQLTTKVWFMPGGLPEPERPEAGVVIERFLKELRTDHIELLLLHCVTSAKWNEELRKQMDIMARFKDKGVLGAVGVSCHSLEALETAAAEPWVDSVHARINAFGNKMDAAPEKVVPVLRKIKAAGKGLVGMKLVGEGDFSNDPGKLDQSLKFVMDLKLVDVFLVGFEKPEQVSDFATRLKRAAA